MGGDAMKIDQLIPPHMLATIRDQIRMDMLTRVQQQYRAGVFRHGSHDAVCTDIFLAHEMGRELDPREVY
jgi:hypothetical protein